MPPKPAALTAEEKAIAIVNPGLVRALAGPQVHAEVSVYPGRPAAATAVAGQLLNQSI